MDGSKFSKPTSMYAIIAGHFRIQYFFKCCSEWIEVFSPLALLRVFLFFHVANPFGFSVMFSALLYFAPKLFCLLVIRLLVCFHTFSSYLLVEFFSLFWNVLFCLYSFILSRYLFSLASFAPVPSDLFLQVVLFVLFVFLFSFRLIIQHFPSVLSLLFVVLDFLPAFPVEFPIPVLSFCSYSLGEHRLFSG